jgi:CheY-like chemotaxis protein
VLGFLCEACWGSGWEEARWAFWPQSILLVEDNQAIRRLAGRVLREKGHTVSVASSGREAITILRSTTPDIVITDLVMPEMEGLELIRILLKAKPGLKVIAISGAFDGLFLKVAQLFGVEATLNKPFSPDQLLEVVARVSVME